MAAAASKQKRSSPAADLPAPVSGAPAHLRPGYIPGDTGVDWLDALASRHHEAAVGYGRAVEELGDLMDGRSDELVAHRREMRTAIAAGQPLPPPVDPAVIEAKIALCDEDIEIAEDALCQVVTDALGELRRRRGELVDLTVFSEALLKSIAAGPGDPAGRAAIIAELARRHMAAIQRTAGVDHIVPLNRPDPLEEVVA